MKIDNNNNENDEYQVSGECVCFVECNADNDCMNNHESENEVCINNECMNNYRKGTEILYNIDKKRKGMVALIPLATGLFVYFFGFFSSYFVAKESFNELISECWKECPVNTKDIKINNVDAKRYEDYKKKKISYCDGSCRPSGDLKGSNTREKADITCEGAGLYNYPIEFYAGEPHGSRLKFRSILTSYCKQFTYKYDYYYGGKTEIITVKLCVVDRQTVKCTSV